MIFLDTLAKTFLSLNKYMHCLEKKVVIVFDV